MVGISLGAAILLAIPLGVLAFYRRRIGRVVFAVADVLQTLPALALLVFLIPWLGIGYAPAIVALFLYSVLPILRNTHAGLADIPASCANPRPRSACRAVRACAMSSCRSRRARSSPASRPRR